MKSYAIENIKRYQKRQRWETIKVVAYMVGEAITAILLAVFAYLWFSIL